MTTPVNRELLSQAFRILQRDGKPIELRCIYRADAEGRTKPAWTGTLQRLQVARPSD